MTGPEPWVWQELEPLLRETQIHRRVAVDVGAHAGEWTLPLAERFAEVWAFEPQMELAVQLAQVAPSSVRVIPGALAEKTKALEFTIYRDTAHLSAVFDQGGIGTGAPVGKVKLVCTALDAFRLAGVGLIKVDVEGAEIGVVCGAVNTIMRCRPLLVIEVHTVEGGKALLWQMSAWDYAAYPVMHPLHPKDSEDYLRHHWIIGVPQ